MKQRRAFLRMTMYFVVTLYLSIGIAALSRYMNIGYSHDYEVGERYHPAGAEK